MNLKKYFIIFFLYSLGISLGMYLFSVVAPEHLVSQAYWALVPFFFVVITITRIIFSAIARKSNRQFFNVFLSMMGVRMLLYVGALVGYSMIFPHDAVPFIILFFIHYLLFTIPEVYLLYNQVKKKSVA